MLRVVQVGCPLNLLHIPYVSMSIQVFNANRRDILTRVQKAMQAASAAAAAQKAAAAAGTEGALQDGGDVGARLWVFGHSLGGAVALMTAAYLDFRAGEPRCCVACFPVRARQFVASMCVGLLRMHPCIWSHVMWQRIVQASRQRASSHMAARAWVTPLGRPLTACESLRAGSPQLVAAG